MSAHPFLRPREWSTLCQAVYSQTEFRIRDALVSDGNVRSAERLIEMGFLCKSEHQTAPVMGIVVYVTPGTANRYNECLAVHCMVEFARAVLS